MFFSLSKDKDLRFPNHDQFGSWYFCHDDGWTNNGNTWFKGYDHPEAGHGNYLKFCLDKDIIKLEHDRLRSCPLWWDSSIPMLTNLIGTGSQIWADETITIGNLNLINSKTDVYGNISLDTLTMDCVVENVCNNLKKKASALNSIDSQSKKLFVTGGIDTLTLLALIKNLDIDCEIIDYEHFEYDYFTNNNLKDIRNQNWAYQQIHHWRTPTILITGSCGDEFMFRGPYTIAIWAAWHDINMEKLLTNSEGYHVGYFNKPVNLNIFKDYYYRRNEIKSKYPEKIDLIKQILNANVNDHQHWHLGNTTTWTPFKDIELTKLVLRLDPVDLLTQIIDAKINKNIIERLWSPGLQLISTTKNYKSRQHLHKLEML